MVRMLQNLVMRANGFKKVMLKDTKGVLTNANNFKWVKETDDFVETVLSTGTRIYKDASSKRVVKPDGTIFTFYRIDLDHAIDKLSPFKLKKGKVYKRYGTSSDAIILKERTIEESQKLRAEAAKQKAEAAAKALRAKRENFVKRFNANFERVVKRSEDGSYVSKGIYNKKTGKLVSWFRKNNGQVSMGRITYHGDNVKEIHARGVNGDVYKSVTKYPGYEQIKKVEYPKGNVGDIITTERTVEKCPNKLNKYVFDQIFGVQFFN